MNLECPYLKTQVELTDERESHIREKHPELLPQYREQIGRTLADPDEVRRDVRFPNSVLFSHWFPQVKGGKFIVVVIVADPPPAGRYWVVTAYVARQLSGGIVIWKRP
ncbi:MAG: hypothetical protein HOP00_12955 [Nitrospira sp.]|nr:hypothetical protein [Nitrospira sp.]